MNDKKLLKLKQEIVDKKSNVDVLKGKKSAILENLKKNWNCDSLEEANTLLKKLRMEIDDLKEKREKGINKLQKEYNL